MRKKPLLIIEWEDASCHPDWFKEDEASNFRGINTNSVGWKIKVKKGYIGIAASRTEYGKYSDLSIIPRRNIISIKKLEGGIK